MVWNPANFSEDFRVNLIGSLPGKFLRIPNSGESGY
jgi:hypothetical protein